jgi:hypothetical protein
MKTNDVKKQQIAKLARKHPKWKDVFLVWLEYDPELDIEQLDLIFDTLLKNKQLLQNIINIEYAEGLLLAVKQKSNTIFSKMYRFFIRHFFHVKYTPKAVNLLEIMDDKIQEILHFKKKEKFIKSLKTASYKELFNNQVESEIHTILDNKITIPALKSQFFKKIARYKTSNDLLKALIDFKSKNLVWNKEDFIRKTKNINANIVKETDNSLMIEVHDYDACKELGSSSWCIVTKEYYFKSYTKDKKRQFIFCDFNTPIESNESMIGFTINKFGIITNSHLKNDQSTPRSVLKKFCFKYLVSEKELMNHLNSLNNQDAFKFICDHDLVKLYDEYKYKQNVDVLHFFNAQHIRIDQDDLGMIQLYWAIYHNKIEFVKKFLTEADLDINDGNNWAASLAIAKKHFDVFKLILDDPRTNPSLYNNSLLKNLLRMSVTNDTVFDDKCINLLSTHPKFDLSINSKTLFELSLKKGKLKLVKKLFKIIEFTEEKYKSIIINTLIYRNLDVSSFIFNEVKSKNKINCYKSIFDYAISQGCFGIVKDLLNHPSIDINKDGIGYMKDALSGVNSSIVNLFLDDSRIDIKHNTYDIFKSIELKKYDIDLIERILIETDCHQTQYIFLRQAILLRKPEFVELILELSGDKLLDNDQHNLLNLAFKKHFNDDLFYMRRSYHQEKENKDSKELMVLKKIIIDARFDLSSQHDDLLRLTGKGQSNLMNFIISNYSEINLDLFFVYKKLLVSSIRHKNEKLNEFLLSLKIFKNQANEEVVFNAAVSAFNKDLILHFIRSDIFTIDYEKNLIDAIETKSLDCFKLFMNHCDDFSKIDTNKLFIAAFEMDINNFKSDSHYGIYRLGKDRHFKMFNYLLDLPKIKLSKNCPNFSLIATKARCRPFIEKFIYDEKKYHKLNNIDGNYDLLITAFKQEDFKIIDILLMDKNLDLSTNNNHILASIINNVFIKKKNSAEMIKDMGHFARHSKYCKERDQMHNDSRDKIIRKILNTPNVTKTVSEEWVKNNIDEENQKTLWDLMYNEN